MYVNKLSIQRHKTYHPLTAPRGADPSNATKFVPQFDAKLGPPNDPILGPQNDPILGPQTDPILGTQNDPKSGREQFCTQFEPKLVESIDSPICWKNK